MNTARAHRRHALRVAATATLIVMAGYVVAALVLNLVVARHGVAAADARLNERLVDASQQTLTLPAQSESDGRSGTDLDDSPIFVWSVSPSGQVTALTPGAPALPQRVWARQGGAVTLPVGTSTFRFDARHAGSTVYVAGQSLANGTNVRTTLYVAELVFGILLAVAVFVGATIVGLRASAPSETVRRRQAEFTADASHELRTPISVIEAEVGLALDRPREPADYRDALQRVGTESHAAPQHRGRPALAGAGRQPTAGGRSAAGHRRGRGGRNLRSALRRGCRHPRRGARHAARR